MALGLSTTYVLLLLLASLCVATGFSHVAAPSHLHQHHDTSDVHHHADADTPHHHAAPDTHHASSVLDICDLVYQVFTATALETLPLPVLALLPSQALGAPFQGFVDATPATSRSIRAPPGALACLS